MVVGPQDALVWLDAGRSSGSAANLGLLGPPLNGTLDGPTFLGMPTQPYLLLPGTAGSYASTPDSAALSVTGDITIDWYGAPDDWTPAADMTLIAKSNSTGNQLAYRLILLPGGQLRFVTSANGSAGINHDSTSAVGAANGTAKWVRATLDVDDGAGNHIVKFYTSDDGYTWSQLGSTVTTVGTTSIFDSTAELMIGARNAAGSTDPFAGKIYTARIFNAYLQGSPGGDHVGFFDPSPWSSGATWSAGGVTWTLVGLGTYIIDRPVWKFEGSGDKITFPVDPYGAYTNHDGTSGSYVSSPDSAALTIPNEITVDVKVAATDWTPSSDQAIIGKFVSTGNQRSWRLTLLGTGRLDFVVSTDGATTNSHLSTVATGLTDGATKWIRVCFLNDVPPFGVQRLVRFYMSDDGVTWTQLGGDVGGVPLAAMFDSTAGLELGSHTNGTSTRFIGRFFAAKVYNTFLDQAAGTPVAEFYAYGMPRQGIAGDSYIAQTNNTLERWTLNGTITIVNGNPFNFRLSSTRSNYTLLAAALFSDLSSTSTVFRTAGADANARSGHIITCSASTISFKARDGTGGPADTEMCAARVLQVIVGVRNTTADQLTAWVNSVGAPTTDVSVNSISSDLAPNIGQGFSGSTHAIMLLTHFGLFDRVLTAAEIAEFTTGIRSQYSQISAGGATRFETRYPRGREYATA